jgi:hypothetical protein
MRTSRIGSLAELLIPIGPFFQLSLVHWLLLIPIRPFFQLQDVLSKFLKVFSRAAEKQKNLSTALEYVLLVYRNLLECN